MGIPNAACLWVGVLQIGGLGIADDESIYNRVTPEIFPVWSLVADVFPRLRSVEAGELSPDGRFAVSGGEFGYGVMVWRVADDQLNNRDIK